MGYMTITVRAFVTSLLLLPLSSGAQAPLEGTTPAAPSQISIDRERFEFNKKLEYDKLSVERDKTQFSGLALFLPLLLGILTLAWQQRLAFRLKEAEAKLSFQLKAAEIVLGSSTPAAAQNRAHALEKLFPVYLPPGFSTSFDFSKLPGNKAERKTEILKMLAANEGQHDSIVAMWRALFPEEEEWLVKLVHVRRGENATTA